MSFWFEFWEVVLIRFLMSCCLGLSLLSACGRNESPKASSPSPQDFPTPVDVTPFLKQFPLLNAEAEEAASYHEDFEGFPLGALVGTPKGGNITLCSASHIDLGYVATNAHCVDRTIGAGRYYVIYFDLKGMKKFAKVESFVYIGNANADDVAILKIPPSAAKEWQTAGKTIKLVTEVQPTPEDPAPAPLSFSVRIWAFDPFSPSHPKLSAHYQDRSGMIFQPRTCQMTRTKPLLVGTKVPEGAPIEHTTIDTDHANSALHFFVDQCDRIPVHGNSGSLVTISDQFDKKIGVFHWGMHAPTEPGGKKKYDYIEYTGSDGRTRFLHEMKDWNDIFGVGYLFEHFARAHPSVLF